MIALRSGWPVLVALTAAVLGWLAGLAAPTLGWGAPVVGRSGLITVAAVSVLCLALGWRVRRDREKPPAARMDPLAAARTLVLGQSSGFAGVALAGWHAGVAVQVALRAGAEAPTVGDAAVQAIGGLVLLAVGLVVERWCRIPPEEDAPDGAAGQDGSAGRGRPPRPETEGGFARVRD